MLFCRRVTEAARDTQSVNNRGKVIKKMIKLEFTVCREREKEREEQR